MHPTRQQHTASLAALDPATDFERIHARSILEAYGKTGRLAYELAYFRTLAMPTVATLMIQTGATKRDPEKRSIDTGLIMFEIMRDGLDGPRAQAMIHGINRAHAGLPLLDADNTYVLAMFMVGAYQWLDRFGWRSSLPIEREASWRFYAELGRRINVHEIPTSYTAAEAYVQEYEAAALRPTQDAHDLVDLCMPVYRDHLPRYAQPYAPHLMAALIGNRPTAEAMGLPSSPVLTAVVRAGLRAKAQREATTPLPPSWFTPGGPLRHSLYAQGYQLSDLGTHVKRHDVQGARSSEY